MFINRRKETADTKIRTRDQVHVDSIGVEKAREELLSGSELPRARYQAFEDYINKIADRNVREELARLLHCKPMREARSTGRHF